MQSAGGRPLGRIGAMPGWALTAESCPSMVAYFLLGRSCYCMRLPREPLPSALPECGDLSGHRIWHFSIVDEPKETLAFWRALNDQVCGSLEPGAPLLGFCRETLHIHVRQRGSTTCECLRRRPQCAIARSLELLGPVPVSVQRRYWERPVKPHRRG